MDSSFDRKQKRVYLDCSNGVSGDMVLGALMGICDDPETISKDIEEMTKEVTRVAGDPSDHHQAHPDHETHFHRSYRQVQEIISGTKQRDEEKEIALRIYQVIAEAESAVHESPLNDLHFHEVGRDQAIANILGVAHCIVSTEINDVTVSQICDGHGTVQCAHGTLTVPVPAVKAMLTQAPDLLYAQTDEEGERVTPSGLAMLIGLDARTGDPPSPKTGQQIVKQHTATGARSQKGKGLTAILYLDES